MTLTEVFSSIANAIRSKTGKTATIKPVDMATEIESIQTGSGGNPMQECVNNNGGDGKPSCYYLFYSYKGTSLDSVLNSLDFSKVTAMSSMFENCPNLISIPQIDTSNVTRMDSMFDNCYSLTTVPQLDTSNVTRMDGMFYNCRELKEIHMTGMKTSFEITSSTKFTESALVEILNNLATVTSTKKLYMGSTNLAKLTDEEKAIATNKGWTLA